MYIVILISVKDILNTFYKCCNINLFLLQHIYSIYSIYIYIYTVFTMYMQIDKLYQNIFEKILFTVQNMFE